MKESDVFVFIAQNQPQPELRTILSKLDFENETYPTLADHCVKLGIAKTKREFEKAFYAQKRRAKITAVLGTVPSTTEEYIAALLDACQLRIDPSATAPVSWVCPIKHQRWPLEQDVLIEFANDHNRNLLGGQFNRADVDGQIVFQMAHFKEKVRRSLIERLTAPGSYDWHKLVETCFDTTEVSADLTIAVLQKFIWQVKRRLVGEPVTHHLLPVIYGSQGCGKSKYTEQFLSPLGSLTTRSDFSRLTDNREADLFKHFAIFLDEMEKADRAEMETVKTVITREQFSYRPMRSNSSVTSYQNATFIGTTNKLLSQLINDPTGNRRFFQLDFNSASGPAEWAFTNAIDWTAMWCSVDHLAEDPCAPFMTEMASINSKSINHTTVAQFVHHLIENGGQYRTEEGLRDFPRGAVSKDDVYRRYRVYARAMGISKPHELQGFVSELRRLSKQEAEPAFKEKRTAKFNGWEYTGPVDGQDETRRDKFDFLRRDAVVAK